FRGCETALQTGVPFGSCLTFLSGNGSTVSVPNGGNTVLPSGENVRMLLFSKNYTLYIYRERYFVYLCTRFSQKGIKDKTTIYAEELSDSRVSSQS
ncbi:MAG: hypothetical protein K2H92_08385, partial [Bacteroidaceae bacterium]|nr:hypothetical protein [Bacteroidaceae bacterium]